MTMNEVGTTTDRFFRCIPTWNPKNPGEHQYATDIKWAESNASIMANFYKDMKTEGKYFKYFVYKDDEKHRK